MKHAPQTRARAARLVREGHANPQVAKATKTSTATIKRWKKDPDFLSMVHGRGVLTLGPVQVRAAESDVLEHAPFEESWVWLCARSLGPLPANDVRASEVVCAHDSCLAELAHEPISEFGLAGPAVAVDRDDLRQASLRLDSLDCLGDRQL